MGKSAMAPLYKRLKNQGFEPKYVRAAILPDWWEDSLFENASNRLIAQTTIARYLDVRLRDMVNSNKAIAPPVQNVRLKRGKGQTNVGAAVAAALHAARITADLMKASLPFTGVRAPLEIRRQLLGDGQKWPDLKSLLTYCWNHGIGVVHVTRLPKAPGFRKIDGLATFVGGRPVIVLCSGRDGPAWLAFHLAHELGHIMSGHVVADGQVIVDVNLTAANNEIQEQEADRYAFQLLTGYPDLNLHGHIFNAAGLASAAARFGEANQIDPGTVALIFGYCQRKIPMAQTALSAMEQDHGASALIADAFRANTDLDNASEDAQRTLAATTQVFGSTESTNTLA